MSMFRSLALGELFFESSQDSVIAHAGGGQANAFPIGPVELSRIATVTSAGDSIKLPPAQPGLTLLIVNHGANIMQVFGQPGDTINDVATGTGVPQMANSSVFYVCFTLGAWYTEGLATGFSGALQTFSVSTGLAALAGGGQTGATLLPGMVNNVTTVTTAADSVALPPAKAGLELVVRNATANSMQVFGSGTDTINGVATATGVPQDANTIVTYNCIVAGAWISTPDASKPAQATTGTTTTTFTAGELTGANFVVYSNTQATPGSIATRTATQMFNDTHNAQVGQTYMLMIVNAQGTGVLTVTAGGGVTPSGTLTIAINTWRLFAMTFTSATAMTMKSVATGTFS